MHHAMNPLLYHSWVILNKYLFTQYSHWIDLILPVCPGSHTCSHTSNALLVHLCCHWVKFGAHSLVVLVLMILFWGSKSNTFVVFQCYVTFQTGNGRSSTQTWEGRYWRSPNFWKIRTSTGKEGPMFAIHCWSLEGETVCISRQCAEVSQLCAPSSPGKVVCWLHCCCACSLTRLSLTKWQMPLNGLN